MRKAVTSLAVVGMLNCMLLLLSAQEQGRQPGATQKREIEDQAIRNCIDNKLQGEIRSVAIALIKEKDRSKVPEIMAPLSKIDRILLMKQILLFLRAGAQGEEEGYGALALLKELRFSEEEKASVVIPWLETTDAKLRKTLYDILWEIDDKKDVKSQDMTPNFTWYESWIERHTNTWPASLVGYMYRRDTHAALLSMSRVYGDKSDERDLADKLKGDPKTTLQFLSDRPEWWAHLYVVVTMKKQPQFRDPTILKKMGKDDNPLVRETVAEILSGK